MKYINPNRWFKNININKVNKYSTNFPCEIFNQNPFIFQTFYIILLNSIGLCKQKNKLMNCTNPNIYCSWSHPYIYSVLSSIFANYDEKFKWKIRGKKIEPVRDKVFLHKVVCKVLYLQHQNLVCKIDLASSVYRMGYRDLKG